MPETLQQTEAWCPRCSYDLLGEVVRWTEQCPLDGRCPECGFGFRWHDALRPARQPPRSYIEALRPRAWSPIYSAWRLLRPWSFWAWANPPEDRLPKVRFALFVGVSTLTALAAVIAAWCVIVLAVYVVMLVCEYALIAPAGSASVNLTETQDILADVTADKILFIVLGNHFAASLGGMVGVWLLAVLKLKRSNRLATHRLHAARVMMLVLPFAVFSWWSVILMTYNRLDDDASWESLSTALIIVRTIGIVLSPAISGAVWGRWILRPAMSTGWSFVTCLVIALVGSVLGGVAGALIISAFV